MAKRKLKFNYYRLTIQWTIVLLLSYMLGRFFVSTTYVPDFEAYCPLGGYQAFSSFLINNSLACSMTTMQITMSFLLAIGAVFFSKLFCGYLCPVGISTEWFGKLGDKYKLRYTITGFADRILRSLKYALFFITFYFTIDSSELFCRKYDPFYASFSGFTSDVVLWMGIVTIFLVTIGAVFLRQFWCKYLCPLSVVTNIFSFIVITIAVFGGYALLLFFGLEISWVYPLAIISVIGFLAEAFTLKSKFTPMLRITRQDDTCTHCKLCDRACPQAITISTGPQVIKHIDCNLCGDCITSCPHAGALKINRKSINWFPAVVTVCLVVVGLFLGTAYELPTVDEKWGSPEQMAQASIFEKSGLKDIKCFGSSSAFVSQMKEIDGVLGAATFVKSHTVKVYFDSLVISRNSLVEKIFAPLKNMLRVPDVETISEVTMGLGHFFDSYDAFFLTKLLEQTDGIFGFTTTYGEPVATRIFFDGSKLNAEKIKQVLESEIITFTENGKQFIENIDFSVDYVNEEIKTISANEFQHFMFNAFYEDINKGKDFYNKNDILVYEILLPEGQDPEMNKWIPYLESHLSSDSCIVGYAQEFTDMSVAKIYFRANCIDTLQLYNLLSSDSLTIKYNDGDIENILNPYSFEKHGRLIYDTLKILPDTLAVE